jgi:hypothetical protein
MAAAEVAAVSLKLWLTAATTFRPAQGLPKQKISKQPLSSKLFLFDQTSISAE